MTAALDPSPGFDRRGRTGWHAGIIDVDDCGWGYLLYDLCPLLGNLAVASRSRPAIPRRDPGSGGEQVAHSSLRFLDPETLAGFLANAGLVVDEQYGDWDRSPLTGASPEIITVARPT